MLVSSTEPKEMMVLGKASTFPERYGADVWFVANGKKVGVQRKEIKDLLASVQDGRLSKEVAQMQSLDIKGLVVEGKLKWTANGNLMLNQFSKAWTRAQLSGLLWSLMGKGIWVWQSGNLAETIESLSLFQNWCLKEKHTSLGTRPGPANIWGSGGITDREWNLHMLQGMPGIGQQMAQNIYEHFGGSIIGLREGVTVEKLMEVKGVGRKKAEGIVRVLG